MAREPPSEPPKETEIEWTPYLELHLLNALAGLKAIGVNHHFCMAVVWQRFTSALHVDVSSETLRKHLETFYDFVNAEKMVGEVPFPNEEQDFCLPEEEFPTIKILEEKYAREEERAAAAMAAEAAADKKPTSAGSKPREAIPNRKSGAQATAGKKKKKVTKRKEDEKPATPEPPAQQDKKESKKTEAALKPAERKLIRDRPVVKLTKTTLLDQTAAKKSCIKEDASKKPAKEEPQAAQSGKKRSRASDSGKKSSLPPPKRARH